jgi:hypothetical protein
MRVPLIVFLFLYLYVCNATMLINMLIVRHLQWHDANIYGHSFVMVALLNLGYLLLGFLVRFQCRISR